MAGSQRSGKGCAFCGDRPLTREHIWAEWFSNAILADTPVDTFVLHDPDGKQRRANLLTRRRKRFCKGCNTGWMSDLENAVKPILGPLLTTTGKRVLFPYAQELLAAWTLKTVLVVSTDIPNAIPQDHYSTFHKLRRPWGRTRIWIGTSVTRLANNGIGVQRFWLDDVADDKLAPPDGYLATIHAHGPLFQLMHHFGRGNFLAPVLNPDLHLRIWPPQPDPIVWPTRVGFSVEHVNAMLDGTFDFF